MKCAEVQRHLLQYSENAIGHWRAFQMRVHIARCPDCRKQLADLAASNAKLSAAMQQDNHTPDIADSVMALIGPYPQPAARAHRPVWAAALALSAVAMGLVVFCALHPSTIDTPTRQAPAPTPNSLPQPQEKPNNTPPTAHRPNKPRVEFAFAPKPQAPYHAHRSSRHAPVLDPVAAKTAPPASTDAPPHPTEQTPPSEPSCVVVVTTLHQPSLIEMESTDPKTGSVSRCSRVYKEDGSVQAIDINYTPGKAGMEEPAI